MNEDFNEFPDFSDLVGKVLIEIKVTQDKIVFVTDKGEKYKLYHEQDCCESVTVEDICGDVSDLLHNPIFVAEESSRADIDNIPCKDENDESYTWTFYKLDTIKGGVTIRWYGESNGCYSESVSFARIA